MQREEKRRVLPVSLVLLMIMACIGCSLDQEPVSGSILDGETVLSAGMPDVAHYRARSVEVVEQAITEHGSSHPLYPQVMAIMQRMRGTSGMTRTAATESQTNEDVPTAEDVQIMDTFLSDTPTVVATMSNTVYEFTNLMQSALHNQPLTIDVLAEIPQYFDVCASTKTTRNIEPVEYSYTVFPDAEGNYPLAAGSVPGIQLLDADQQQPYDEGTRKGFVITKPSVFKSGLGGGPWPRGVVWYWWDDGFAKSDSCPRKQAVRDQMEAITSLMTNQQGQQKIHFYCVGSHSWYLRWRWYVSSTGGLRIMIDNGSTGGSARVGYGFRRRLRYGPDVVDTPTDDYHRYVLQHELCHVLGLKHEHQRNDRDRFIEMRRTSGYNEQNHGRIKWKYKFLFWTYFRSSNYGTPYDYNSIMHYDINTIDGPIFRIRNESHQTRGNQGLWQNSTKYSGINDGTYLSPYDIYTIKRHYGVSPNPMPTYTPGTD